MAKPSVPVLIVEDNPQDAALVEAILARDNHISFTSHRAVSLKKAVEFLQSRTARAVLLDLSLVNGSWLDTFGELEKHTGGIPVIVLCSDREVERAEESVRLGAQDYLIKSDMDSHMVPKVILHAIERKQAEQALHYQVGFEKLIALISADFLSLPVDQLHQAIRSSLGKVAEFLGGDQACLCLFAHQSDCIECVFEWYREGNRNGTDKKMVFSLKKFPWLFKKLSRMEAVSITEISQLPGEASEEARYFKEQGTGSFVRVPLPFKGNFVAYLAMDILKKNKEFSQEVLALLKLVGEIFVVAYHRKIMESQLEKLSLAVEQSPSIVMITDDKGRIEYVNPKFTEVTGYALDEIVGKSPNFLKSGKIPDEEFRTLWETITKGEEWQGEFINRKKNGELYWERAIISSIKDSEGRITHYLAVKEDITKRKWAEETIQHMAYYDPLTDLPNRMLFNDRLGQALAQARRKNQLAAILFLDLDRFKVINDTLGHTLGDLLLRSVAERLKRCTREGDTIARMGGDEFTFLLTNIAQVDEAVKTAHSILDALKPSFNLEGHEVHITPSIGISIFPYDGNDGVTLVKNADAALNRAKEQGRTNYQLYTPVMNAKAFERMTLENSLRKALEKGEFTLYYQPQVDLKSGDIVGMEALLRWEHPDLGLVSPAQFIPMAEETGLIVPIGQWVLRTACQQNKEWQNMGYRPMSIAVNLSARQFNENKLVDMISGVLKETGLDPCWLEVEITESIIMQNLEQTIATLRALHHLGVKISIDDFGTGYSSLAYLKKFPVHALKIDQSFIREITTDPDDAAITAAVIAMGHSLKLKVIAEGVETMEQLEMIRSMKCDCMQGYLFSRPVPAQTITPLLMEGWHLQKKPAG